MGAGIDQLPMIWGKTDPFHPLACHMIDVGWVAHSLVSGGGLAGVLGRVVPAVDPPLADAAGWLAYLAAMHDLGKCRPEFQCKMPELVRGLTDLGLDKPTTTVGFRHEAASADWLKKYWRGQGWDPLTAGTLSCVAAGHHGNFRPDLEYDHPSRELLWEPLRQALNRLMQTVFRVDMAAFRIVDHSVFGTVAVGLTVLADWIASNEKCFPRQWQGGSLLRYADDSRAMAQDAVHRLGFDRQAPWTHPMGFRDAWPKLDQPRPVQMACERLMQEGAAPGLTIVEAPMGEGKSEAAMYLAAGWIGAGYASGLYLAMPTGATSNQMFRRLRQFLASQAPGYEVGVQLVHGASFLVDTHTPIRVSLDADADAGSEALEWFEPHKRSLLAPFGVGTIDQALMATLHIKYGFLRLFGLASKVLIVDEVHAYDAYMMAILRRLLAWCHALGIPVVLLSATLPAARRHELVAAYGGEEQADEPHGAVVSYPLITSVGRSGKTSYTPVAAVAHELAVEVTVEDGFLNRPDPVAQLVWDRLQVTDGCFAVLVNTVSMAQAVYDALCQLAAANDGGNSPVVIKLFHARFLAEDRDVIEQDVVALFGKGEDGAVGRRPRRAILVATQVVEQSLDVDFDEMYSDIAPMDLLLQRVGRLHRHERGERPTGVRPRLHVLGPERSAPDWGTTAAIYSAYVLWRTWLLLSDGARWRLPADLRALVEGVYSPTHEDLYHWPTYQDDLTAWLGEQSLEAPGMERPKVVPPPSAREFALALADSDPYVEDETATSFLVASTRRRGNTTRVALVDIPLWQAVRDGAPPSRTALQALMRRTVNVPHWWFQGLEAAEKQQPPASSPRWLHRMPVFPLTDGKWQGRGQQGDLVSLCADPVRGVSRDKDTRQGAADPSGEGGRAG